MNTELTLIEWLEERWQNTIRIAKTKYGADRQGWLEDASYLHRAREAVRRLMEACSDGHANLPIRTYIALKILRAWNNGTDGFDGEAVSLIHRWFDSGMKGPVPWPKNPFFSRWAEENGLSEIRGFVGFKFDAKLPDPKQRVQ